MNITEAVGGQAGIEGVRWALLGPQAKRAIRRALGGLAEPGLEVGPLRLTRAKFKPDRKLTAHYDAPLRFGDGDRVRPIVVTWTPNQDVGEVPGADIAAIQAEADAKGLVAPFRGLVALRPGLGMRILVSPMDPRMPQLVRASEPDSVRAMVAAAVGSTSRRSPRYRVSTVRYRPGERHVLRYDPVVDAGSGEPARDAGRGSDGAIVFAKMSRDDDVARQFRVAARVCDWLDASEMGLRGARPLAALVEDRVALYGEVPGGPLSALLRATGPAPLAQIASAGRALRSLHRAPAELAAELERRDFDKEVRSVARAAEHIHPLLPRTGAKILELLERLRGVHGRLPGEEPTFTHSDFKADHLLVADGQLTLLDFGTCAIADPALDVGKFLSDLHWWYALAGRPGVQAAQRAFLEGYGGPAEDPRLARARVYEILIRLKSTIRRVPLFDPGWPDRTKKLVALADRLLRRLERS